MKKNLGFILILLPVFWLTSACAQESQNSIQFRKISYAEALKEAGTSQKLIFIDCYTSWCAPCKWMEKNVFVNDSIYSFFNKHFINLKMDMEKGEGVDLRKKYAVASYPTYLFVNNHGDIIHRTASRMEVSDFLEEGKKAIDPRASYAYLKGKYESGDRSNMLLFEYAMVLRKINRDLADKVEKELLNQLSDKNLKSNLGWQIIDNMARNENDRLGKFFILNKTYYEGLAGKKSVETVALRLSMYTMYGLIRDKDSTTFFRRLNVMKSNDDPKIKRDVAMLGMEYYLNANQPDSFVAVSGRAMNGILEYNDADLSFIARRALYMAKGNKEILNQSLILARKAVVLNPEEYSNQGTLASICLESKLKDEGLKAALKARELSNAITSKIQKLAQQLVDKLEQL